MKRASKSVMLSPLLMWVTWVAQGQTLKVDFIDKSPTQTFAIPNVQNLRFSNVNDALLVKESSGLTSINLLGIKKITFDQAITSLESTLEINSGITVINTVTDQAIEILNQLGYSSQVALYGSNGKLMTEQTIQSGLNTIDLTNCPNGLYILKTELSTIKILKR